MRPKDLKFPFAWEARHVVVRDHILYVPKHYDRYAEFSFPGWGAPDVFGNDHPVKVECCSGNGSWIAMKAAEEPNTNWVAIEQRFVRVRKIWSKMKNRGFHNLFAICGEAYLTMKHYFPSESVSEFFINFPDPWPKKRHAKNRLIQAPFVEDLWRVLKDGACVTIVTDDPEYSEKIIAEFEGNPRFVSEYPFPFYVKDLPQYGSSFFEELWREKGKTIRYHRFKKSVS